jgi:hypothetical protein
MRSETAFAHLCGVAPIPASSGKTHRHRPHRSGDRAANNAFYTIALTRLRLDNRTHRYLARELYQAVVSLPRPHRPGRLTDCSGWVNPETPKARAAGLTHPPRQRHKSFLASPDRTVAGWQPSPQSAAVVAKLAGRPRGGSPPGGRRDEASPIPAGQPARRGQLVISCRDRLDRSNRPGKAPQIRGSGRPRRPPDWLSRISSGSRLQLTSTPRAVAWVPVDRWRKNTR